MQYTQIEKTENITVISDISGCLSHSYGEL